MDHEAVAMPYIGPVDPEPVPAVVDLLKLMLQKAEARELIAVGVACVKLGGHDAHGYTIGSASIAGLNLAICRLQQTFLDHGKED